MALIKCNECGHQVSDSAKACPSCGAATPKKHSAFTWVALAVIGFAAYSTLSLRDVTPPSIRASSGKTYHVMYGVEAVDSSTSSASLTYNNDQGGIEQQVVDLPWLKVYPSIPSGAHLYLSAQNRQGSGQLKVKILVDGAVAKESLATGGYTIATASGSCC